MKNKIKQTKSSKKHFHKKVILTAKKMLKKRIFGFTLVELIVVIVVIAILSTISFMTYPTISKMANVTIIRGELGDISKQLKIFHVLNDTYPATIDCQKPNDATNICVESGGDGVLDYVTKKDDTEYFYVTIEKNGYRYNVDQDGIITAGPAPVLLSNADNYVSYNGVGNTWVDINTNSIQNGGLFGFDGSSNFISSKYLTDINSQNITIAVWVRPGSTNGVYEVFSQGEWGTDYWIDWSFSQVGKIMEFNLKDKSLNEYQCSGGQFTSGDWHYVVGVWNDNLMSTYIDGLEVASCSSDTALVRKGSNPVGVYDNLPYYFNGLTGDISIYDKALTVYEIQENFNITKVRYIF